MSGALGLIWLTHGAGPAFEPAAHGFAAALRPGDRAVLVDLGGGDDTPARQARFFAEHGFHDDVAVHRILARPAHQPPGGGDWRAGVDAGLAALAPAPPDRLLIAGPGVRPDAGALARARDRMDEEGRDLLRLTWTDREAGAPVSLFALLASWALIGSARLGAGGLAALLWQIEVGATSGADHPEPLGEIGAEAAVSPGPEFAGELAALVQEVPDARDWAAGQALGWAAAGGPGARAGWAEVWPRLTRHLPGLPGALPPLPMAPPLAAPPAGSGAPVRVYLAGRHAHRTPFAYDGLADLWQGRAEVQPGPEGADLVVFAHPSDPLAMTTAEADAIASGARAALISEEPFWDTLFSPDPLAAHVTLPAGHLGRLRLRQVNHHTSALFDWEHLPYYLFTQEGMIARLADHMLRHAARAPGDWPAAFAARPVRAAFMAERRPEAFHDLRLPRGDIEGLCAWRTRLAEAVQAGPVERLGASWQGGTTRFEIDDWHGDKLARLDGRALLLSGIENTHQPTYVSEKIFDAFACGALPLYVASPGHWVHRLGLPEDSWLNLYGMTSAEAATRVDGWAPGPGTARAYGAAQAALAARLTDVAALAAERARIGRGMIRALDMAMGDAAPDVSIFYNMKSEAII